MDEEVKGCLLKLIDKLDEVGFVLSEIEDKSLIETSFLSETSIKELREKIKINLSDENYPSFSYLNNPLKILM